MSASAELLNVLINSPVFPSAQVSAALSEKISSQSSSSEICVSPADMSPTAQYYYHHELLASVLVSGDLYSVFANALTLHSSTSDDKLAVLEVLWRLAQSKSVNAVLFIKDGKLVLHKIIIRLVFNLCA